MLWHEKKGGYGKEGNYGMSYIIKMGKLKPMCIQNQIFLEYDFFWKEHQNISVKKKEKRN